MRLVQQVKKGECGLACIAMVLGISLEEADKIAQRVLGTAGGCWGEYGLMDREMVRILKDQGLADAKASLDWPSFETSAILTVPSLNYSGLLHYIVWDAEAQQYLDPANEPLRYPDDGPVIAEERTVCWATAILW